MNPLIRQSIIDNVHKFCDNLTDSEMQELVTYFVYEVNMSDRDDAKDIHLKFIDEFFEIKDWFNYLEDIDNPKMFMKSSNTLRTNLDFIQKVLLSDAFVKYTLLIQKRVQNKPQISNSDKKMLKNILSEYEAMLEYQLEDEKNLNKYSDENVDLVEIKKKELKFIKNFKI